MRSLLVECTRSLISIMLKPPGCMCGPSLQHLRAAVNLGAIPSPLGLIPSTTSVALGVCRGQWAELVVFDVGSSSQGLGFPTPQCPQTIS